jgi:DNA-binding response OmpR family regulator
VDLRGSILVADPDPRTRGRLARRLGEEGYLPFSAGSVAGALEVAREMERMLDLALLDDYFPDGAGLDACGELRVRARGVRVIVMTRDPSRQLRREALFAGAYAVVPKPIRSGLLLATVEAALARRGG